METFRAAGGGEKVQRAEGEMVVGTRRTGASEGLDGQMERCLDGSMEGLDGWADGWTD